MVTKTYKGWALTFYRIMHHRWDLENCIFRQDKTTGRFGHDPAIIEALVGDQLIAVTWWIWWTTRKTVSAACKKMPRIKWIEMAREALGWMRTTWIGRWRLQTT